MLLTTFDAVEISDRAPNDKPTRVISTLTHRGPRRPGVLPRHYGTALTSRERKDLEIATNRRSGITSSPLGRSTSVHRRTEVVHRIRTPSAARRSLCARYRAMRPRPSLVAGASNLSSTFMHNAPSRYRSGPGESWYSVAVTNDHLNPGTLGAGHPHGTPGVAVVFSAFKPGDRLLMAIDAVIAAGVLRVIVVNDGTPESAKNAMATLKIAESRSEVLHLASNSGIASAINHGIRTLLNDERCHAILTLDQDTVISADGITELLRTLVRAEHTSLDVAGVAPAFIGDSALPSSGRANGFKILRDPIQSGLLVRPGTYVRTGLFREDFFIDAVDTEFSLRCSRMGMVFVAAESVSLDHNLGEAHPVRLFGRHVRILGRPRSFAKHTPLRTYYMVRNAAVLRKEYRADPLVRAKSRTDLITFALTLVYGPDRRRQLLAMVLGSIDARRRELGRVSPRRSRQLTAGKSI